MQLDALLKNNEAFLKGEPKATRLPSPMAVLTCIDCRLNDYLGPAFGILREDILLIRNAGNVVSDSLGDPLRSLAMGIYLKGATEILVLGHTDCRMSQFEANNFLAALSQWGVNRQQLGPVDLRRWAGAFYDPRQNVKRSVELIGQCPFIPRSVPVHGMMIDIASGKLEVVVDGNQEKARRAVGTVAVFAAPSTSAPPSAYPDIPASSVTPGEAHKPAATPSAPAPRKESAAASPPVVIPSAATPAAPAVPDLPKPKDLMGAIKILRQFYWDLRLKKENQVELEQMRARLAREQDPVRSFQIVEETAHRLAAGRTDVAEALRIVRDHVARSPVAAYIQNLLQQILKG